MLAWLVGVYRHSGTLRKFWNLLGHSGMHALWVKPEGREKFAELFVREMLSLELTFLWGALWGATDSSLVATPGKPCLSEGPR